jgi:integrase
VSVFQPTYKDPKTGKRVKSKQWWYDLNFAGKRIREPAKTTRKTVARDAEQKRRRELEQGYNGLVDRREERIRTIAELTDAYLTEYGLRHSSDRFAKYALGKLKRHLGKYMVVEVAEKTVTEYQSLRLKEKAAPKTINEEVGFLLRLLGDQGEVIRARLRRLKMLKLAYKRAIGKAYTSQEKDRLLHAAKAARSPVIYPALMLALNAGMRDSEIRNMQWGRLDLSSSKPFLIVGDSKTEAGAGRTIPLNTVLLEALVEYSKWYTKKFGTIQPEWYLFAFGKPRPKDPTKPMVTLKTAWKNVRTKAKVKGRWHDNRHTFITCLAESGQAGDETIRDIAGHVSKRMLKHYSHIGMEAKRRAVESLVPKKSRRRKAHSEAAKSPILKSDAKESPKVA